MQRTWPEDWESRKQGAECRFCRDLSQASFHSGRASEALLERKGIAKGHTAVVFRGRHVASLADLTADELRDYWRDIQDVGRMVEQVFSPCHMNYMLLGNLVPHLHVHVVPRYLDDAAPGRPLAWETREVPADEYARQCRELQAAGVAVR